MNAIRSTAISAGLSLLASLGGLTLAACDIETEVGIGGSGGSGGSGTGTGGTGTGTGGADGGLRRLGRRLVKEGHAAQGRRSRPA